MDTEISDSYFTTGLAAEKGRAFHENTCGACFDLIKAFNKVDRKVIEEFFDCVCPGSDVIKTWLAFNPQLRGAFRLQRRHGPWIRSKVGFPELGAEGCPWSVIAMAAVSHLLCRHFTMRSKMLGWAPEQAAMWCYAVNRQMLLKHHADLQQAVSIMHEFTEKVRMQVSTDKSWVWSCMSKVGCDLQIRWNGKLLDAKCRVRDLGAGVSYTAKAFSKI